MISCVVSLIASQLFFSSSAVLGASVSSSAASISSTSTDSTTYYLLAVIVALLGVLYLLKMSNSSASHGHAHQAAQEPSRKAFSPVDPNKKWTLKELKAYNGSDASGPILLGCNGLVFDVTSGASFYGPDGPYGVFAGKDASRGLATMQIEYTSAKIDDLSASQKATMKEWAEKFEVKYPVVGKIEDFTEPNSGPAPADGKYTGEEAKASL